jgi:subtilase family serine protease
MSKTKQSYPKSSLRAVPMAMRAGCLACGLAVVALGAACSSEDPTSPSAVALQPIATPAPALVVLEKPDLVISNLNFSPGQPTVNDEVTFWVDVKNEGPGPAGASTLIFKVGGETYPPETAVPALAVSGWFRLERRVRLDVVQGYMVTATADAKGQVAETNEDNNVAIRTFRVTQ